MSAPILRVAKVKNMGRSTPKTVQDHNARLKRVRNADPRRTPLNVWLAGSAQQDVRADIHRVMREAGIDPAAIRRDATIANDMVLSVSPEWFRPDKPAARGTYDQARVDAFVAEAKALLAPYGNRVVSAVLHVDEATPHLHAVIVPIMPPSRAGSNSWRLSGKDMFNPAALRALQQSWEDRLAPHGVGQRIAGSKARHSPVKRYYAALGTFGATDPVPTLTVPVPAPRGRLESTAAYDKRVETWRGGEGKKLRSKLKPLTIEASQGRLYEAERRSADQLRGIVAERTRAMAETRDDLANVRLRLDLSREEIAALRATPINAVAVALGWMEPIGPRENAIDLVKRVGGVDFNQAVAWLSQRFGSDVAATAVREDAERTAVVTENMPAVFTKGDRVKRQLVARQLDALAAPAYRLTLMKVDEHGKKVAQNLGKSKVEGEPERRWTRDEVLNLIPELSVANYAGRNILLTPLDPHAHHMLLDDITGDGLRTLASEGYSPALVLETSPGNHQVVLKVPRTPDNDAPAMAAFTDLNRTHGDEEITGLVHPVRLVGFENRKAKHYNEDLGRHPFVGLATAVNRFCERTMALVREYLPEDILRASKRG